MDTKDKMDNESIVAKPEYASSEFSSEAPPAYKIRSANSVKIAKIIAFTIILSSFILGSFMLASTYLQAKATCDQVSALDAVLEKELMLEAMQQDLPRPEALQTREASDNNLVQDLSKDEMNKPNKKDENPEMDVEAINTENEVDSNDNEESNDMRKVRVKMPLDFDLTELAHNLLMNNQKSRMNCVVERRRTEEAPKPMNPFSAFLDIEQLQQPKEKVTGERVSIFCETGGEQQQPKEQEPIVHVRRIIMPFPLNGMPGPMNPMNPMNMMNNHRFGPPPQFQQQNQFPMPPQFQAPSQNQMNFPPQMRIPFHHQMPFNPQPQPPIPQQQEQMPPIPAQMMSPPRPEIPQFRLINPAPQNLQNFERPQQQQQQSHQDEEEMPRPEVRIQLRRIQLPGPISDIFPFLNNIQNDIQKEMNSKIEQEQQEEPRQNIQVQQMPLAVALSKVGITPDDLRNIQRMAEEKFHQHIRELVADEDIDSNDSSISNEDDGKDLITAAPQVDDKSSEEKMSNQEADSQQQDDEQPQILALGRSNFGRSLNPIQLPIRPEIQEAERQHDFVQPR